MKGNFLELRKFLEFTYPELRGRVAGQHYPPPQWAQTAASLAQVLQLAGTVTILAGGLVFGALGMEPPGAFAAVQEHKWPVIGGLFVLNSMANSALATGAFEVFIDGELALSRLATGQFPGRTDILRAFAQHGLVPVQDDDW
eukprot:TRINITY_DN781_c0_g4_i1.p2 TRINITY_DN781_c0_g4~~TRINITY_DN781_c0_g4_i1.p2  ORF type:complete len:142 (-),score=32.02 TRINITY_DN781_c0_g4_i1:434-859(-)